MIKVIHTDSDNLISEIRRLFREYLFVVVDRSGKPLVVVDAPA
jgi:hypothetical protein